VDSVKIAQLKNHLSRYVGYVREGAELIVVDRDTPVARLIPFAPRPEAPGQRRVQDDYWTADRLAALERQGTIRRADVTVAQQAGVRTRPTKLPKGAPGVVDLLLRMRRESAR
jgi:prevent-host-death family protein